MFEPFSAEHYAALAVSLAAFIMLVLYRKQLREPRANRIFRMALGGLLLVCEASLQISYFFDGGWTIGSLPFQLCSVTLLLSGIMLLFRIRQLYAVSVFLGTLGALQAMLTPNLDQAFPQFRYFHFFIAHIAIIAAAIYLLAVEKYKPTLRSVLAALLWLHALAVPAAVANIWSGTTNFMFLVRKPSTASLLDALAPWPWYLLQLELVAAVFCLIWLGVIHLMHVLKRRMES